MLLRYWVLGLFERIQTRRCHHHKKKHPASTKISHPSYRALSGLHLHPLLSLPVGSPLSFSSPSITFHFFFFLSFKILNLKTRQGSLILSLFIFFFFSLYQLTTFTLKEFIKNKKIKNCAYLFSKMCFQQLKRQNCVGFY